MSQSGSTSFWATLPGVLTAVAGVITAVTGLLVVLNQLGDGDAEQARQSTPTAASSAPSSPVSSASTPTGEGDVLAGTWRGTVSDPDGANRFDVRLEITAPCRLGQPCGTISVTSAPCTGRVTLWTVRAETYELYVDQFTPGSASVCTEGAGEYVELLDDGTLRYTTSYSETDGVLHKVT